MGLSLFLLTLDILGLLVLPLGLESQLLLLGCQYGLQFLFCLVHETMEEHVPLPNALLDLDKLQRHPRPDLSKPHSALLGPHVATPRNSLGQLRNIVLSIRLCLTL